MRNIFKSISIAVAAVAVISTSAIADEICYNLCLSCRNTERAENCDKIESTCNCPFVIDSARSKNMGVELRKRKLVDDLVAGCTKAICARTLTFQDGYYKGIEKGNTTLTRFELIAKSGEAEQKAMGMLPRAVKAVNATIDSLTRRRSLLPIAPMSMECTERCNDCATPPKEEPKMTPADSLRAATAAKAAAATQPAAAPVDTVALAKARADSIAKTDSSRKAFCRITETSCQCKAHADNTLELIALDKEIAAKNAIADSLVKIKSELLREDMARAIADSVQARCNVQGMCRFTVTYTSKEVALLEMHVTEEKPVPAPAPVETAAPAEPVKPAPADTAKPEAKPAEAPVAAAEPAKEAPAAEACPQDSTNKDAKEEKKDERIFYKVTEVMYGNFGEHSYYAKDIGRIRNLEEETGHEAALIYLMRWYFYDGGAISIGLGASYHYKSFTYEFKPEEKYDIYYHNIGADIPISFRLGVPVIPVVKPFISQTFHFHKPIFEVYKVETPPEDEADEDAMKAIMNNFIDLGMFDDIRHRFNGAKELSFSVWLGFGLQITRHFSVEYQMNFGTASSGHAHKFDPDESWRIVVDLAW